MLSHRGTAPTPPTSQDYSRKARQKRTARELAHRIYQTGERPQVLNNRTIHALKHLWPNEYDDDGNRIRRKLSSGHKSLLRLRLLKMVNLTLLEGVDTIAPAPSGALVGADGDIYTNLLDTRSCAVLHEEPWSLEMVRVRTGNLWHMMIDIVLRSSPCAELVLSPSSATIA